MRKALLLALLLLAPRAWADEICSAAINPCNTGISLGAAHTWTAIQTFTDDVIVQADNKGFILKATGGTINGQFYNSIGVTAVEAAQGLLDLRTGISATDVTVTVGPPRQRWVKTAKTLSEAAATSVVRIGVAAEGGAGGQFEYTVYATDGATPQVRKGRVLYSVTNDGGTETCVLGTPEELDNTPTGTLTATITCDTTPANAVDLQVNATSSLTQTTLEVYYQLSLDATSGASITPQ